MATSMASATPISTCIIQRKSTIFSFSASVISYPKTPKPHIFTLIPKWGGLVSPWNGLKHLGISIRHETRKKGKKGNCRDRVVYASLFGVGAPEALVIGVVALLVFGPKGLAEVARNLGKTLRAFQPTIRELQEVSREFKTTLEREIGLDEISTSTRSDFDPSSLKVNANTQAKVNSNGTPTPTSSSSEELVKVELPVASALKQQTQMPTPQEQLLDGTSPTTKSYSSEELLKLTEDQLTAIAAKQNAPNPKPEEQTQENATGMPSSKKPENEG
ncbi:bacterial sec-independent translocation protein mttA/Hcf106 isoform X2 [Tasmannia lanceolata]|uniref:bacterial sec-independent translocation protein mttA/Hcf106 isoform X2 n=1 Tax=Tasmannia lanceolata TaxID=3420 RepID=UPI0040643BBA